MKEENNGYLGFACFFFFIAVIVAAGSIILYNNRRAKLYGTDSNESKIVLTDKKKKDKNEEFIYYNMEESISEELNIIYKKANINLDSEDAITINTELEKIYDDALLSVKMSNETDNICENGSKLYSAVSLEYAVYSYKEYITLLIMENNYSCNSEINIPSKVISYTFDITTGKLITDADLLNMYNLTYTDVLNKIEYHLNSQQITINNENQIKIDETLSKLKYNETYAIYISETKKLVVKYIVKTNSVDYNDIIELN